MYIDHPVGARLGESGHEHIIARLNQNCLSREFQTEQEMISQCALLCGSCPDMQKRENGKMGRWVQGVLSLSSSNSWNKTITSLTQM